MCSSWRDGRPIYCGKKKIFFFDVFSLLCVIVFQTASVSVDHIELNGKPKSYKKRHCVVAVVVVVVVFVVVLPSKRKRKIFFFFQNFPSFSVRFLSFLYMSTEGLTM